MTKQEKIMAAIGEIDSELVEETAALRQPRKSKNQVRWVRWAAAAACVALGVGLGLPALSGGGVTPDGSGSQNTVDSTSDVGNEAVGSPQNDICYPYTETSGGYEMWYGKTVTPKLIKAMEAGAEDTVYPIAVSPYVDYTFVSTGKTLGEYYQAMANERILPEILAQLLKEGESLKYGTLLYEGGAPNGEKWAKSFYEERVRFYGEKLLAKYLVNGEFLAEKVREDIAAAKTATKEATIAYKAAFAAYQKAVLAALPDDIRGERKANGACVVYMTRDRLKQFTAEQIEAWTFGLYEGSPVTPVTDNAAIAE